MRFRSLNPARPGTFFLLGGLLFFTSFAAEAKDKPGSKGAAKAPAAAFEEPAPATPAPANSSPMKDLDKTHQKLQKLVGQRKPNWSPDGAASNVKVKKLVGGFLDFKELAKRSLNKHWDSIPPAKRAEFVATLQELVERSYVKQMHGQKSYKLSWDTEEKEPTKATVFATLLTERNGKKIDVSLEYRLLHKAKRGWVVYDVVTDEQSLLETYRAEFNKVINKESFDSLLSKMKKKLAA